MSKLTYKNYLLTLLTFIAVFNYLDRIILSLLLEPIKQDLNLNDSQLGLLTGFAFSAFYALAGIPLAQWADRGNRNILVFVTTAIWSSMVALSGAVGNFTQFLLVRVGVAVGEAGCVPAAQSLIADHFDRAERPHAMAIYWLCYPIAVILGYFGGGLLADYVGWRLTFIVLGVIGVLIALLAKLTLYEPRLKQRSIIVAEQPSFKEVLDTLCRQPAFRRIVLGFCVAYFFGSGFIQWMPTFFARSHAMDTSELGMWLALSWGVCGLFGTYLGGYVAVNYAAGKEALQMRTVAILFVFQGFLYAMVFLSSNKYEAMTYMAAVGFVSTLANGPVFSAIQSLANNRMRSISVALIFLLANLIGAGFGPLITGVVSDLLVSSFGKESLRYALMILSPGLLWPAYFYWRAAITIEEDIHHVELTSEFLKAEKISFDGNTM